MTMTPDTPASSPDNTQPPMPRSSDRSVDHALDRSLARTAVKMTRDVNAAALALKAGSMDAARDAAGALSDHVARLDGLAAKCATTALSLRTTQILRALQDKLSAYGALVSGVRDASQSLAQDAQREQRKRAGGGLYAATGAAPTTAAAGRFIGKL